MEYIAIPVKFPQFAVLKKNVIHRYDEPMKHMSSGDDATLCHTAWNEERCQHALVVLKRRFLSSVAERVFNKCKEVADEFLR